MDDALCALSSERDRPSISYGSIMRDTAVGAGLVLDPFNPPASKVVGAIRPTENDINVQGSHAYGQNVFGEQGVYGICVSPSASPLPGERRTTADCTLTGKRSLSALSVCSNTSTSTSTSASTSTTEQSQYPPEKRSPPSDPTLADFDFAALGEAADCSLASCAVGEAAARVATTMDGIDSIALDAFDRTPASTIEANAAPTASQICFGRGGPTLRPMALFGDSLHNSTLGCTGADVWVGGSAPSSDDAHGVGSDSSSAALLAAEPCQIKPATEVDFAAAVVAGWHTIITAPGAWDVAALPPPFPLEVGEPDVLLPLSSTFKAKDANFSVPVLSGAGHIPPGADQIGGAGATNTVAQDAGPTSVGLASGTHGKDSHQGVGTGNFSSGATFSNRRPCTPPTSESVKLTPTPARTSAGGSGSRTSRSRPKRRTCSVEECKLRPLFGVKGTRNAQTCAKHKLEGFVNVLCRQCEVDGCTHQPSFGMPGAKPIRCFSHQSEGMTNLSSPKCTFKGCRTVPSFAGEGITRPTTCATHRKKGFVDIVTRRCGHEGCGRRPVFGFLDGTPGRRKRAHSCSAHKLKGMVNVFAGRCAGRGCTDLAVIGAGSKKASFCAKHL